MTVYLQKKSPATNWYTIHKCRDLESAKALLSEIADNYDADSNKSQNSCRSDDGLTVTAYDGGDAHRFRIVE